MLTAPFFVNFSFLWFNEKHWFQKLELVNERTFHKAFRFIDGGDILTCCVEFGQYISESNRFNQGKWYTNYCSFFWIYTYISLDNKFTFSIYSKDDVFSFSIFIFIISYISKRNCWDSKTCLSKSWFCFNTNFAFRL